jgi:hypothetical protein
MSNNVKLLLVDDNPMVLGMLQQALTPSTIRPIWWSAITACREWTAASLSRS